RRQPGAAGDGQTGWHGYHGSVVPAWPRPGKRCAFKKSSEPFWGEVKTGKRLPLGAIGYRHRAPEGGHLGEGHQPAVIVLVPGTGEGITFDRVGYEAGRPVVLDRVEGGQDRIHVVSGEVGHQALQCPIVVVVEDRSDPRVAVQVTMEMLAPALAALVDQR